MRRPSASAGVRDERLLLEARRHLATTDVTVAALSAKLGVSEPANFVKFSRRMTGHTPRAHP